MSSEETGGQVAVDVPEDLRSWLERTADERSLEPAAYVRELLVAHRAVDDDADEIDDAAGALVDEELLSTELEALRDEYRELVEDVRDRVIQIKRETDGKASADHDHEELSAALEAIESDLEALKADLDDRRDLLASLREDVDRGFENFEDVLEYLLETTDDQADRVDRLARATVATREQVRDVAATVRTRERADELKRDAALEGIGAADCEDCGQSVRAALLTAPECPYCAAGFVDVAPKRGLLGSATFRTGDRPALAGAADDRVTREIEADLEAERPDPADVDWDTHGGDDG